MRCISGSDPGFCDLYESGEARRRCTGACALVASQDESADVEAARPERSASGCDGDAGKFFPLLLPPPTADLMRTVAPDDELCFRISVPVRCTCKAVREAGRTARRLHRVVAVEPCAVHAMLAARL